VYEQWLMCWIDDIDFAHSVVFQSHSLGDFGFVYFSIPRGSLVSGKARCSLLLFKALILSRDTNISLVIP